MRGQATLQQFNADIFHALSHPTRVAILEMLRAGETSGQELSERLEGTTANTFQHLAVLRSNRVIVSRRAGHQVYYTVRSPLIFELLDVGRRCFQAQMSEMREALQQMEGAEHHE